ncbi:MAG: iron ABC transporter permease, partial [bacterium]|nr:iron ABC transporter permease [bacterium]
IAIFLFVIIVLLPIGYMVTAPVWSGTTGDTGAGVSLFGSRHIPLVLNSLGLATGTTLLGFLIGVPMAFFLCRIDFKGRRFFNVLYLVPLLIPSYIHAIAWSRLNPLLKPIFGDIHSLGGAVWVLGLSFFPIVTLMVRTGLQAIDRDQEEAALLHRSPFETLKGITLPLLMPYIVSSGVLVFLFSLLSFGVPDFLRLKVYPLEIFIQYSAFYNESSAAILSIPLLLTALLLLMLHKAFI